MQTEYTLQSKTFKIEIDADFDMYDYQTRFVICGKDGAVIDDAQGYGYKTAQAAHKAAWYKLNGGKKKVDGAKKTAIKFWRTHKDFAKALKNVLEINFKNPMTDQEIIEFASTHGVANFDPKMVKYLWISHNFAKPLPQKKLAWIT